MIQIPSQMVRSMRQETELVQQTNTKANKPSQKLEVEQRSQRSASADDRSNAPFSINESELFVNGNNDYDSAHASFADWVEIFETSKLDIDVTDARNLSTTARAEIGFDFEPSEEQGQFRLQLNELEDVSAIDALNEGFINEHSMITPMIVTSAGQVRINELGEVKARLANLEV